MKSDTVRSYRTVPTGVELVRLFISRQAFALTLLNVQSYAITSMSACALPRNAQPAATSPRNAARARRPVI